MCYSQGDGISRPQRKAHEVKRILLLVPLLLTFGCTDDFPVLPERPVDHFDRVVQEFGDALEARDADAIEALLDPDPQEFYFLFGNWDEDNHDLPTWYMRRPEFLQSWRTIFAGALPALENGETVPAVTAIEIVRLEVDVPWEPPPPDHYSWWRYSRHIWEATYHFEITVSRAGLPPVTIGNKMLFLVRSLCGEDSAGECSDFALMGFDDQTGQFDPATSTTFGSLLLEGFVNNPPEVAVRVEPYTQGSLQVVVDACETLDEGLPITREDYRFRLLPDGDWSMWDDRCSVLANFREFGEQSLEVEVRDRWGLSGFGTATIDLQPPSDP